MNDSVDRVATPRLTPRAVRVRNRCLAALARRAGVASPNDGELAALGQGATLADAWSEWRRACTPADAHPSAPRAARRLRFALASVAAAAVLGATAFLLRDDWLPRANAQPPAPVWEAVTDSVRAGLNEKLLAAGGSDVALRFTLSAAEIAGLVARSPQLRTALRRDSVSARVDSLVWIRARARGGASLLVGGTLRVLRPGVGNFRVVRFSVDDSSVDSSMDSSLVQPWRYGWPALVRFALPRRVGRLNAAGGAVYALPADTGSVNHY